MKILKGSTSKAASELELKNRELARKAAREGFVLLENDGTLPLKDKRIALYGAGARMTLLECKDSCYLFEALRRKGTVYQPTRALVQQSLQVAFLLQH